MPSVQLARLVHEAVLLIIRRSWVRAPPAPPIAPLCETGLVFPRRDRVGEVFVVLWETENRVDGARRRCGSRRPWPRSAPYAVRVCRRRCVGRRWCRSWCRCRRRSGEDTGPTRSTAVNPARRSTCCPTYVLADLDSLPAGVTYRTATEIRAALGRGPAGRAPQTGAAGCGGRQGLRTTFSQSSRLFLKISKPRSASSSGRVWVMIRVGSISPRSMRCSSGFM